MRHQTRITLGLSLIATLGLAAPAAVASPMPDQSPAATPTAAHAATPGSRADMDGDGRPDRTTFTKVRSTSRTHTFRLSTRTATGRTISTLITIPANLSTTTAKDVWWGAAPIDGAPGAEVVLDRIAGVGDFPDCAVYTIRGGAYRILRAPGARSDRTDWSVSNHPSQISGYAFSTSRGVRRVVATRLKMSSGSWDAPVYSGYRTTYRWGRTGWISSGTQRVKDMPDKRAQTYAGWLGITLR